MIRGIDLSSRPDVTVVRRVTNIWYGKAIYEAGCLILSNDEQQICIQPEMVEKIKVILEESK